jgi:hypothetical protein
MHRSQQLLSLHAYFAFCGLKLILVLHDIELISDISLKLYRIVADTAFPLIADTFSLTLISVASKAAPLPI